MPWGRPLRDAGVLERVGLHRPNPVADVKPPACTTKGSRSTLSTTPPSIKTCSTATYRFGAAIGQPFETRLIDAVGITLRKHHRPCLLRHKRVTLAVQGKSGGQWVTLRQIDGNPGSRIIGTMLTQTYGAFETLWAWANWCRGGNEFRAYAKVGTRTAAGPTATQGATCEGSRAPSTLTPSYGHS